MPELPEVETVVRGLAPQLSGAIAGEAIAQWPGVLDGWSLAEMNACIPGQVVESIHRRGKYICIKVGPGYLVVHLRMTGRLYISDQPNGDDKWVRFSLGLDQNRWLAFSDARKFGRVTAVDDLNYLETKLGPEPLTLKPTDFKKILQGSRRAVKTFLLDQKRIAGVGNIYADEALFRAKILPTRPVDELSDRERTALGKEVIAVLSQAINYEGATISWYRKPDGSQGESQKHFTVYGKGGQACEVCSGMIEKMVLGQRGTHYCPRCQK